MATISKVRHKTQDAYKAGHPQGGLVQDARVLAKWPPGLRAGRTVQLITSGSP